MKEKEMNRSFYDLVVKMRRWQKSYFATQDKGFLETSLKEGCPRNDALAGSLFQDFLK